MYNAVSESIKNYEEKLNNKRLGGRVEDSPQSVWLNIMILNIICSTSTKFLIDGQVLLYCMLFLILKKYLAGK